MKHIVKRHGSNEEYDEKKIYASVYAAALNCHYDEHQSEQMAQQSLDAVNAWIHDRPEVDSMELRDKIAESIPDEHVKMMYREHLDVC